MIELITLIIFSFCTASLAVFLDFSFEQGEIFHFYNKAIDRAFNPGAVWLYKILGGCVFCFGTWLFICTYLIMAFLSSPSNFQGNAIFAILGIGLNYVWIKILIKI